MKVFLPTLWMIFLHIVFVDGEKENDKVTGQCYGKGKSFVSLYCGYGLMINIKRAFHGAHKGNQGLCTAMLDDCTEENSEAYDWSLCIGLQYCVQPVKKSYLQNCKKESHYLQVEYECVSVRQVLDVCDTGKQIRYDGYISSPDYPSMYKPNVDCKCHLIAVGGTLQLTFADLALEDTSNECRDWVLIKNQTKEETFCNQDLPSAAKLEVQHFTDIYFSSNANDIMRIKLANNKTKELKGFWLHFKGSRASTKITVTCSPTDHPEPKSVKKKIHVKNEDDKFQVPSQMRMSDGPRHKGNDLEISNPKANVTESDIIVPNSERNKGPTNALPTNKTDSTTSLPAGATKAQFANYLITVLTFIKYTLS